jgi:hypothetical protein
MDHAVRQLETSFLDPAVSFLTDSIAQVVCECKTLSRKYETENQKDLSQWQPGDTWALFVLSKTKADDGLLMELSVERIDSKTATNDQENSVGSFYPHPHLGAHFAIGQDLQEGIRNAWLAWRSLVIKDEITGDYRWSLIPLDEPGVDPQRLRHILLCLPLTGQSPTLAFAAGISSAYNDRPLCLNRAATACFKVEEDVEEDIDSITSHAILYVVTNLPTKAEVIENAQIKYLVVASNQTTELPLQESCWKKATDLQDALRLMSEPEQWLEEYADWIAGRWDRIVEAGKPGKKPKT